MANIKSNQIAYEIAQAISNYTEDVKKEIEKEVDATSKKILDDIKKDSPKRTGDYSKGWRRKTNKSIDEIEKIVYQKDKPGLIHLLEFGHLKRGGTERTIAQPHMQPAIDRHVPAMEKRIEKIIERGGK